MDIKVIQRNGSAASLNMPCSLCVNINLIFFDSI